MNETMLAVQLHAAAEAMDVVAGILRAQAHKVQTICALILARPDISDELKDIARSILEKIGGST